MSSYRLGKALSLFATLSLTACNHSGNSPFRHPVTTPANSISPAAQSSAATAPASGPSATPYVLSAQSAGPFIDFTIYNLGSSDLSIRKEDFAILTQDSREVTPYDKASAVIDLPQPAVAKPNETIKGRAIFHKVSSPTGRRLVFKPDNQGTFADINPVSQPAQ